MPEICDACGYDAYDGGDPLRRLGGRWLCPRCAEPPMAVPDPSVASAATETAIRGR